MGTSCGEARHAADECDIKVFCCPKLGNSLEEYEDAWAHRQTRTPVGIRVAVADGATESSFAKLWAVLLAESYVRSELAGAEFFARLKPARRLWRRRLAGRPLPWFASEKAKQCACAGFLGVEIDTHRNHWTALAVGDCCLMQVDDVGKGMRAMVLVGVNLDTEKSRKGTLLGLFASEPGERSARLSSPPEAARWLQPRKKLCPGELTSHIALGQQHGP